MGDDAVLRFDDRGQAAGCVQAKSERTGLVEPAGTSERSDLGPSSGGLSPTRPTPRAWSHRNVVS